MLYDSRFHRRNSESRRFVWSKTDQSACTIEKDLRRDRIKAKPATDVNVHNYVSVEFLRFAPPLLSGELNYSKILKLPKRQWHTSSCVPDTSGFLEGGYHVYFTLYTVGFLKKIACGALIRGFLKVKLHC